VEELSPSGARCRLRDRLPQGDPRWGAPLQLKFTLPDSQYQVVIIARLVRVIEPDVYGISFAQTTERDSTRLTEFCLQIMRERKTDKPDSAADRGR
jgi:hypothetical protein